MEKRDAFDVVREVLVARSEGLMPDARVHEFRHELLAVAARMENVKRRFPSAAPSFGLGEDFQAALRILKKGHGFLRHAALF